MAVRHDSHSVATVHCGQMFRRLMREFGTVGAWCLQTKARAYNRRMLEAERQGCVAFERNAHPTANAEGGRTPALRFGDPRVMALTGATTHPNVTTPAHRK